MGPPLVRPRTPVTAHGRGLPQGRRAAALDGARREIDQGIAPSGAASARAYRALREECGRDRALFAAPLARVRRTCRFDELNELIRQHNEWYPIERDLPMDPRTGDYVISGRSYRRPVLGPEWVLEQFPAA